MKICLELVPTTSIPSRLIWNIFSSLISTIGVGQPSRNRCTRLKLIECQRKFTIFDDLQFQM